MGHELFPCLRTTLSSTVIPIFKEIKILHSPLRLVRTLLMLLAANTAFGQDHIKPIHGSVKSPNNDVENILIINLNSRKSTITDSLGLFTIEARLNDSIRFTAVQYKTKEIIVTDSIFLKNTLVVNLADGVINLNEVMVTPYDLTGKLELDIERSTLVPAVTSSTLGLPNAVVKKMTQSERLLTAADRGKYVYFGLGIALNTHKILNNLSGRTKSFEDRIARDEKMELEKDIIAKFPRKTISESFNIPETNIDGFLTYCMLQEDFLELSQGSTSAVWEYLKVKSLEYKETDLLGE